MRASATARVHACAATLTEPALGSVLRPPTPHPPGCYQGARLPPPAPHAAAPRAPHHPTPSSPDPLEATFQLLLDHAGSGRLTFEAFLMSFPLLLSLEYEEEEAGRELSARVAGWDRPGKGPEAPRVVVVGQQGVDDNGLQDLDDAYGKLLKGLGRMT